MRTIQSPFERRDSNEPEIISALVAAGSYVLQMPHSVGFDLLVIHPSGIYIAEVKQPGRKLTAKEEATKIAVEMHGQKYHVLRTIDDALQLVDKPPMFEIKALRAYDPDTTLTADSEWIDDDEKRY